MLDWMVELLDLPDRFRSTSADRRRRDPGLGERGDARGRSSSARWRATGGRRQPRRRHDAPRRLRHGAGALEHREGAAHRRHRHRPDPRRPARPATFAHAPRRAGGDGRRRPWPPGLVPFFVCASRGTTSSLAFDPTPAIADVCARARHVAARRRGDERHRRARARAALGQRRPRARRQLLHQPAQVDGRQLRLRPVLDRRPRGPARRAVASCPSTCARRPPSPARRSTTATGRSRSAAASGPSSCG